MLVSTLFTTSLAMSTLPMALGYPGMETKVAKILARQNDGTDEGDSNELIGDLVNLPDSQLTYVGSTVKQLLTGNGTPQSSEVYTNVPALKSAACGKDTCCVWKYIADDMAKKFRGGSGRCNKFARAAVRLGFHDAGGWNKQTAAAGGQGGADGSIILNSVELTLPENSGLQEIAGVVKTWYNYYNTQLGYKSVTMADLIQMGATVATVVCPLGPRIRSYVGRTDSNVENPRLLPGVTQSADDLIQLFEDKTIKANGLVALLGAHTTSQQFFVDTKRAGDPQDSTPGVWDVKFYSETGASSTPKRVFQFASDVAISKHPKASEEWKEFAAPGGQEYWGGEYAREYIRLSLLGVNNINSLTECTKVLPDATKSWSAPDQKNMDKWLNSVSQSATAKMIADSLNNGDSIVNFVLNTILGLLL